MTTETRLRDLGLNYLFSEKCNELKIEKAVRQRQDRCGHPIEAIDIWKNVNGEATSVLCRSCNLRVPFTGTEILAVLKEAEINVNKETEELGEVSPHT